MKEILGEIGGLPILLSASEIPSEKFRSAR